MGRFSFKKSALVLTIFISKLVSNLFFIKGIFNDCRVSKVTVYVYETIRDTTLVNEIQVVGLGMFLFPEKFHRLLDVGKNIKIGKNVSL